MDTRKLTVYAGSGKDYDPISKIILQGKWLEDLGFSIGDKVTVACQQGKLVIERAMDGQAQQEAMETVQQAGKRQGKENTYGRH